MQRTTFICLPTVLAALTIIALAGCMGRSQPARFYTLTSIQGDTIQADKGRTSNIAIGIGPIKLADYLDQSRIVIRTSENTIKQAEFDQWSGTLRNTLSNILAENIGQLLGTGQVYLYPWRTYIPIDYQVIVDIVRLDGQPGREVELIARWSVLTGEDNTLIATERSNIREKISGSGFEPFVAAQSQVLGKLSREIARKIQTAGQN